jgi:hypothetical protein
MNTRPTRVFSAFSIQMVLAALPLKLHAVTIDNQVTLRAAVHGGPSSARRIVAETNV